MPVHHLDPLQLHTILEAVAITRRSRSALYEDIKAGRLRVVKLGRQTRIPRVELERYIRDEGQAPK